VKGWQTHRLGDVVDEGGGSIQTGPFGSQLHASDYVPEGIPCIMPANLKNNRVDISGIARISEHDAKRLKRHIVQTGDIVYSRRGDVTQKALITERENGFFCGTGCLLLRPGTKIDSAFLTYYLSTTTYQSWIASQAVGATMPNLNTGILNRVSFCAPNKSDQTRIAAALAALDAKIELNNRINEELEGMAKLLYDYWFVQFDFPITAAQSAAMRKPHIKGKPYRASGGKMIYNEALKREIPDGWEGGNILAISEIGGGATPSKKAPEFWGGEVPFFTPTDAKSEPFCLDTEDHITQLGLGNSATRLYPQGTLFITARGSVGKAMIISRAMAMNQSCYALCPHDGVGSAFLYFHTLSLMDYLHAKSSGSVFNSIVTNDINFTPAVVPAFQQLTSFNEVAEPMFKSILTHQEQNQQLTKLRDWLLPMLMNGQVTVS